jgi:UDP-glucose 4-epimerase
MQMTGKKTVVITGATGFIGQHLCTRLVELGQNVVAVQRKPARTIAGTRPVLIDDIAGEVDWPRILDQADCVIHLAASAHRGTHLQVRDADRIREVNAGATRNLASAAVKAGVKRFVFLSSIAANGSNTTGRAPFGIDDRCAPQTSYGRSKVEAEQALQTVQQAAPELSVDIIRCPAVIGRNAPGNMAQIEQLVSKRIPLPFSLIHNRRAFIAVDDLNSFISARLAAEPSGVSIFMLAAMDRISTPDFVRAVAAAKRTSAVLFPFPATLLRGLLVAANMRDKADALTGDLDIDNSSALESGWRPALSIKAAIQRAYAS